MKKEGLLWSSELRSDAVKVLESIRKSYHDARFFILPSYNCSDIDPTIEVIGVSAEQLRGVDFGSVRSVLIDEDLTCWHGVYLNTCSGLDDVTRYNMEEIVL